MAKIKQGRLDAVYGMKRFSAAKLHDWANELERQIDHPDNTDDPKWLRRWASKIRKLAKQKERAIEHKSKQ